MTRIPRGHRPGDARQPPNDRQHAVAQERSAISRRRPLAARLLQVLAIASVAFVGHLHAQKPSPPPAAVTAEAEPAPMLVDDAPKALAVEKTAGPAARADDLEHTVFKAQADAPPCHACGSIMVRSGACYKCFNCGATSGCS